MAGPLQVSRSSSLRQRVAAAVLDEGSTAYRRAQAVVITCILISVVAIILESVPWIAIHYAVFDVVEGIVVAVFTLDYLANIWVAPDRWKYALGPWGIIDLLAILPTFALILNIPSVKAMRLLRVMRVLRVLRVLKLAKVATARFQQRESRGALRMDLQIYFITLFCALTLWSTLVYYAEHQQKDTLFTSIPQAMWWGITTLTTTGYGDMAPVTFWGRVLGGCTMITGLALFGLLMNVVGEALHRSLFGTRQQMAAASAGEGTVPAAAVTYSVCGCGQPLNPAWRVCPMCQTPLATALSSRPALPPPASQAPHS